jgi:hypothetical protein
MIARPLQNYRGLVEVCRARAEQLAISRLEIDRISGLPNGYSAKLLGHAEGAKPAAAKPKRMWPASLEAILGTLGLKILVIEDEAATARTLALREPVDSRQQRFGNVCRISAKLWPPPKADSPPTLTLIQNAPPAKRMNNRGKYG